MKQDAETATIDHKIQQGYHLSMAGESARACDIWIDVWHALKKRLTPQMRTCDSAESALASQQLLFNWCQDFVMELTNASINDSHYAKRGIVICNQILDQFTAEQDCFCVAIRADLGELYCRAGQLDRGEQVFLDLITDFPDSAIGYVHLADVLANGPRPHSPPIDIPRARSLLEQALNKSDANDFDVALRLEDLSSSPASIPSTACQCEH